MDRGSSDRFGGFFAHDQDDEERGASDRLLSNYDEEEEEEDEEDTGRNTPRDHNVQPSWPQSYRQSMDVYSHLASPHILMSPMSGTSRPSLLSPRPSMNSSFRRRTPLMGSREEETAVKGTHKAVDRPPPVPKPHVLKVAETLNAVADTLGDTVAQNAKEEGGVEEDVAGAVYHTEPAGVPPQGSSAVQAMFNGVNVLAGVGVLSVPYAVMTGGWLGLVLLFGFAAICFYTGLVLRHCLDSQPGLETYPDIGGAAFGSVGRLFISVVLYVELYACCVEFLILEGDNLAALFPSLTLTLGPLTLTPTHIFVLLSALAILPTVWLRDLSVLSYVSAGGVLASLVVVVAVFWVGAVDGVGFTKTGPLLNPWGLPVSIGLYGFCYSGHAVFPNLYTSLKNRNDYSKVLLLSFISCATLYGVMAAMGFAMFGDATQTQITLNLPNQYVASQLAVWTTVVNPFTKYALTMTPVALSMEELLPMHPDSRSYRRASLLIRTALVASTVAVALLVPFFGYVMAFIGSFLSMSVSIILPCACYLRILGKRATALQITMCYTFILVGLVCAFAGTYASVAGIIYSWQHSGVNDEDKNGNSIFSA